MKWKMFSYLLDYMRYSPKTGCKNNILKGELSKSFWVLRGNALLR